MAKVLIEYDTVEKTMACTLDGQAVADIGEVVLYRGYSSEGEKESFRLNLTTVKEDKEQKTRTYTQVIAAGAVAPDPTTALAPTTAPGPITATSNPKAHLHPLTLQADIEAYLQR